VILKKVIVAGIRDEQEHKIRKQLERALKHILFRDYHRDKTQPVQEDIIAILS
jgi:hypothetical protein